MSLDERKALAWHETLEIHELVASQANGLMRLKMSIKKINDPQLRSIYQNAIKNMEMNLQELIQFYPSAPVPPQREDHADRQTSALHAGELLGLSKALVRNYALAITETATPVLRKTLTNHLLKAIKGHEAIFNYMYSKGLYPAYDLERLLRNDLQNAQRALSMRYE